MYLLKKLSNTFTDDDKNVDRKEDNYVDVVKDDKPCRVKKLFCLEEGIISEVLRGRP